MSLLKRYYILFLCVNIFLPKLNLGFGSFYVFEFINLFLFGVILLRGKVLIDGVTLTYFIFILICHLSFLLGFADFGFFDSSSYARLIKFTFFLFYIVMPYLLLTKLSEKDLINVINAQLVFFLAAGSYVLFYMITEPKSIHEYVWDYNNQNRLVGLTGYGIDLKGNLEKLPGSTSVAMGVYVAFIFLVFLSRYHFYGGKWNFIKMLVLVALEFIVYSRSGLLVMAIGLIYYFLLNARPATILRVVGVVALLAAAISFFNIGEKLTQAGSLSKVFNMSVQDDPRYRMLETTVNYIAHHPQVLLLGGGFGEKYTYETVGYTQLEGLLPTTLISSGVFAVLTLCLHFFIIWFYARSEYLRTTNEFSVYLFGTRLFVPGWALTALISGNTFQTDFYFPVIYFIIIVSYYLSKRSLEHDKPATSHDQKKY